MMVLFIYEEDIARTVQEAITLYKAKTLIKNQKVVELQKRVYAAVAKEENDKSKWLHKLVVVANTAHGLEFLDKVQKHYCTIHLRIVEMVLEKLQLTATTTIPPAKRFVCCYGGIVVA